MALPKLELNLSEENDIGFSLKIMGTDKDIGASKPKIRFTITEAKTGRGWIFNAEKGDCEGDDNGIHVTIPDMKSCGVMEGEKYDGKLEVIMGTRFFTPTEVDIEFIEPLKVEAAITTKSSSETLKEDKSEPAEPEIVKEELSVESEIDSVIVKKKQPEPVEKPAPVALKEEKIVKSRPQKISYRDLSDKERTVVNKIFVAECKKLGVNNPQKYLKEGTSYTKKRLRALIAKATKQVVARRKS